MRNHRPLHRHIFVYVTDALIMTVVFHQDFCIHFREIISRQAFPFFHLFVN